MPGVRFGLLAAALLSLSLATAAFAASADYTYRVVHGPGDLVPAAMNASGQVVGHTERGTSPNQPWFWDGDTLTFLDAPGGVGIPRGINAAGVIVGYAFPPPSFNAKPFRWVNGSAEEILPPPYVRGWALAINDSGEVLLELATSTQGGIFVVWKDGAISAVPGLGAPVAINNPGHLAGGHGSEALAWLPGIVSLDLGGALSGTAVALNDSDRVVGRTLPGVGEPFEAVYWDGDSEPTFIPGMTQAMSVNGNGLIGGLTDSGPAIFQGDSLLYMATFLTPSADEDLTGRAALLNDAGTFVCTGYDAANEEFESLFLFEPSSSPLVVNDTRDLPDTDPNDGVCDADAGTAGNQCTLRAAIETANHSAGRDSIPFDIEGAGPHVITLDSPLPAITEPLVLDATTQPGWTGRPVVTVTGASGDGLVLPVGESALRGLAIGGFPGAGVKITGPGGNRVLGCAIGTNAAGAPLPNGVGVLVDGSAGNAIGGIDGRGNLVSGNTTHGVHVRGAASTDNVIEGNFVGTDFDGAAALANGGSGVRIEDAPRTRVGGGEPERNFISGNAAHGVHVSGGAGGTVIAGNFIGLDVTGAIALANGTSSDTDTGHVGVLVEHASSIAVGGSNALGNVIAGNTGGGVRVIGDLESGAPALAFELTGNRIGTDAEGNAMIANGGDAVRLAGAARNARIGKPGAGNVIVLDDGTRFGVRLGDLGQGGAPDSSRVQSNRIGVSLDGTQTLGAARSGVELTTTSGVAFAGAGQLRIGGTGAGNVIASARYGIYMVGAACDDLLIEDNIVGMRPDGSLAGGAPGQVGVLVVRAHGLVLKENTVGGQTLGVMLATDEATVTGNRIGTNPGGGSARPNQLGMLVPGEYTVNGASPVPVGDDNSFVGNVISGNTGAGLQLGGAVDFGEDETPRPVLRSPTAVLGSPDRNVLIGNRVGTDASGLSALGNGANEQQPAPGVWLTSGEENVLLGNLLSGNGLGLYVGGAPDDRPRPRHTRIGGNIVGGSLGGGTIPNRRGGVLLDLADDTVIAPAPVTENGPEVPNLFQGNLGNFAIGVIASGSSGVRNVIRKGVFTGNVGPSILHVDADDPAQAPAGVPGAPVMLHSLVENDQLHARVMPQATGPVDVYLSQNCVGGIAQGFHVLTLDGVTGVGADITLAAPPADPDHARVGWFLAATSTRSGADSTTSAFSACLPIADPADTAFAAIAEGDTGTVLSGAGIDVSVNPRPPLARRALGSLAGLLYAARHRFAAPNDSIAGSASSPSGLVIAPDVVAPDRYWSVAAEGLTGTTCTVCLDANASAFAHPQQVVVVRRDAADQPWTPLATTLHPGTGRLCAAGVTAFGEFSVAADSSNLTTSAELALGTAEAAADRVTLTWYGDGAGRVEAHVERIASATAEPVTLGPATLAGRDALRYVDTGVAPGTRYGYRLAYTEAGRERFTAWTWVEVPLAAEFALEGLRPNPSSTPREVVFTLVQAGPVQLELYDVGGRRLWSHAATLAAGRHVIALRGAPTAAGVYLVRLQQGARTAVARGVIVK